jgi:hypothetical protein
MTSSPLTRAWTPIHEAGSLWVRARAPFAKRRYGLEFERFKAFVLGFPTEQRRPLKSNESQAMADDAVLLRLLDVDLTFSTPAASPNAYQLIPGYRQRGTSFAFREWLVIHERRLRTP